MSTRIMVFDDDESIRELFEMVLRDEGWDISSHEYANTNLAAVQQLNPDLIILDLNVHQRGRGWEFLQLLKMEDATASIPVLICTTATHLSHEIEGYLAVHHIVIIRKPFDIEEVVRRITRSLALASVRLETLSNQPPIAPVVVEDNEQPRAILFVEANEDMWLGIRTIFRLEGYSIVTAATGALALAALAHARYRVIILDITLPVLPNLDFLAAYARQPGQHSPVIVFSADADRIAPDLPGFVIGVLSKPVEVGQLLKLVNNVGSR